MEFMEEFLVSRLPEEINLSVFSRLPLESVLDCRRVCKAWNAFLDFKKNTYFANLHLRCNGGGLLEQQHHSSDSGILNFVFYERRSLYYVEYREEEEGENKFHTRMINLRIPLDVSQYVGSSCNGLICFSTYKTAEPAYICNPITRELVHLPRMVMDKKKKKKNYGVTFVHGFGYHPLIDKYKVVRICYDSYKNKMQLSDELVVDVYTLGSRSGWRNVGETGYSELSNNNEKGSVCVNGALHWLSKEAKEIVAFDLANEKFCSLPTPPGLSPYSTQSLHVINGCLCLVYQNTGESAHVWFRKKNIRGDSSTLKEEYSWSKEFHIANQFQFMYLRCNLVCLTNNGKAIILEHRGQMFHYNLETTASKEIWRCTNGWTSSSPLLHVNSLVSMQALGEEDVKTFIGSSDDGRLGTHRGGRRKRTAALKGHFQSKRTRISKP